MPAVPIRRRAGAIALCSLLALGGAGVAETASAAKKKKPLVITSKQIKNGTIQSKDLAKSVQARINAGAKALKVIANGSVGTAQLADGSITGAKIADLAVTTTKLAEGAVTNPKLGNDAVTSSKVAADSLTAGDLAPDAVGASELAPGAVSAAKLANGSTVTSDKIGANGTTPIDFGSIAANTCGSDDGIDTNTVLSTNLILLTPGDNVPTGLSIDARPTSSAGETIRVVACNVTNSPIDPPEIGFSWAVMEN